MADAPSPNPYIRTYAKDMAALSGKALGAPIAAPQPQTTKADDRDAVLARLRQRTREEPVHENVVMPSTIPTPVPQAPTIPSPPAVTLVRPAPLPPSPPPPPKPVAPPLPRPQSAPLPPSPAPELVPKGDGPIPLHTYKTDFADRIDQKGASTFSVLAAQMDTAVPAPAPIPVKPKSRRNLIITLAGVALVVIGGGGAFAAYLYVKSHSVVQTTPQVPSLIFADDRVQLTGEGSELVGALADAANTPLPDGQVRVVYLATASTTAESQKILIPLSGGELIGALQLSAPDILLRNIAPESTVGIVHKGDETRPFFILKVLSYERTFAGMLTWESSMQSSLAAFYPTYPDAAPTSAIATTTKIVNGKRIVATTTVAIPAPPYMPPHFIDEVSSNHDVRALKDAQGRTILLYGYKDKDTLIIARDEAAFAELVNRLSATKQQ